MKERKRTAGMTLLEMMMAMSILAILLVLTGVSVTRESKALSDVVDTAAGELRVREMLTRLEDELQFAQGALPETRLSNDLNPGQTLEAEVDPALGFPDRGVLLLSPGTAAEERIAYDGLSAAGDRFLGLTRAQRCTLANAQPTGQVVRWAGTARVLEDQVAPPPTFWDGVSRESIGQLFYRGDGSGFSFRVPTDPAGGTNFLDGEEVRWGATVRGNPLATGWSSLYFQVADTLDEGARQFDFNSDGDLDDSFDLGRIRMRSWDTANPAAGATDVALCPPMILQEQCAWSSDMDNDGFQDPMFLWDPATGRLRVRLFVLEGTINQRPQVNQLETVLFLRNGAVQ